MGPRLPRPQHAQARPRAESVRRRPRHRLNPANPPKAGQIRQFRAQTRSYPSLRRRAGYYLDRLLGFDPSAETPVAGVAVSYETIRRWLNHFGPMVAADLPKRRLKPHSTWRLNGLVLGRPRFLP